MNTMELELPELLLEQCLDRLDECVARLADFPEPVLALALRTHLAALLGSQLRRRLCTREHARRFLEDLIDDALEETAIDQRA